MLIKSQIVSFFSEKFNITSILMLECRNNRIYVYEKGTGSGPTKANRPFITAS